MPVLPMLLLPGLAGAGVRSSLCCRCAAEPAAAACLHTKWCASSSKYASGLHMLAHVDLEASKVLDALRDVGKYRKCHNVPFLTFLSSTMGSVWPGVATAVFVHHSKRNWDLCKVRQSPVLAIRQGIPWQSGVMCVPMHSRMSVTLAASSLAPGLASCC